MADVSHLSGSIELPQPHWLWDHQIDGTAVLPAAHLLDALACELVKRVPGASTDSMGDVELMHFVRLAEGPSIPAFVHFEPIGSGHTATLWTRSRQGRRGLSRIVEHLRVTFDRRPALTFPIRPTAKGFAIESARLYAELVPLGPAFRNLIGTVHLLPRGVGGWIAPPSRTESACGSPFVLDAALHLACVWGQRYAGIVTTPVGMTQRCIFSPSHAGVQAFAFVQPVRDELGEELVFDLWIWSETGAPLEASSGVRMRASRSCFATVPEWVRA
jgi:hypothetical protein